MNKTLAVITAGIVVALGATGCSSAATSSSVEDPKITAQVETALASLEGTINGTDPNGVTPSSFSDTELTDSEIAEIKSMGLSAGVAMHSMSDAWSVQLVAGLEEEFANLGIELVGVTDAENDPAKQTTQIESLLAASPDFIVSLPTDPVA
ncbi:MAG TPA: substrate-binding domain-containing protein, partial [Marisediminicola sp.]|nr:substrate-binding domain-containing protein [Marisediminicola sp.]